MTENHKFDLTIVVPVYNEEDNIQLFIDKIVNVIKKKIPENFSILFVNDASKDSSLEILKNLAKKHDFVEFISFSRNFGQDTAIFAGLDNVNAKKIAIMDCDLQDPPELLLQLMEKMENEDLDIVLAKRKKRKGENLSAVIGAIGFYKIFSMLSSVDLPQNTGYFRLMNDQVLKEVLRLREQNGYVPAKLAWLGFKRGIVEYDREPRNAGTPTNFMRKFFLAIDAITSFSVTPLRIAVYLAFTLLLSSFIIGVFVIINYFFSDYAVGWASLMCIILFGNGVQALLIGIIGEYIGRIYTQTKNRPLYIIREEELKKR